MERFKAMKDGVYDGKTDKIMTTKVEVVLKLNELIHKIDNIKQESIELDKEKEYWKSIACTESSFNSILLNELDYAQEQGYEVSNPFKKLMEEKNG